MGTANLHSRSNSTTAPTSLLERGSDKDPRVGSTRCKQGALVHVRTLLRRGPARGASTGSVPSLRSGGQDVRNQSSCRWLVIRITSGVYCIRTNVRINRSRIMASPSTARRISARRHRARACSRHPLRPAPGRDPHSRHRGLLQKGIRRRLDARPFARQRHVACGALLLLRIQRTAALS